MRRETKAAKKNIRALETKPERQKLKIIPVADTCSTHLSAMQPKN
jgi:hypothetical protein